MRLMCILIANTSSIVPLNVNSSYVNDIQNDTGWFDLIFGFLTPLSAIFQLYHGDQF